MAGRPLRPATRRRLGRPSPHQQADRPRAHPPPKKLSTHPHARESEYPVLDPVSQAYPRVKGRSPTCYSPVRRSCTPKEALPLDLHVLSTPPAFVLSQDLTLQQKLAPTNTLAPRRGRSTKAKHQTGTTPPVRTKKLDTLLSSQKTPAHRCHIHGRSIGAFSLLRLPPYTVRNRRFRGGPGG